jgi:hypothetical protein
LVTAVYEDELEKKFGVPCEAVSSKLQMLVRPQRPKLQQIVTTGMFLYYLCPIEPSMHRNQYSSSSSGIDEIDSFYAAFHVAAKDVSIVGVNAE